MRVVIDVNVWISGSLWGGIPDEVLRLAYERKITSYVSIELLQELEITLKKPKFEYRLLRKALTIESVFALAKAISTQVEISEIVIPELRDPKDAKIVATAIAASAEVLITGDLDLLVLQSFQGISILTPTQFLSKYKQK